MQQPPTRDLPLSLFNELKRRNVIRVGAAYVVVAWLLIQVAETIFPLFGFDDTPARIVVIVLAIGFVPSMIVAWVFELTPEGLIRDGDVDRSQFDTEQSSQKLNRVIMVVLALALGYFAFDKFVLDPVEDVQIAESAHQEGRSAAINESFGDKSIAVMPFANLSTDSLNQFFADGIHDDLLTRISTIQDIKTISRSSVMTYRGSDKKLGTIARELGVSTILEGGVQRAGDQVRINLKLIDAVSDASLWAQTYTRELTATNVFVVQGEIAEAVAGALQAVLSEDEREQIEKLHTANLQALDAYFLGNQLFNQETTESVGQAIEAYQEAIRLDPEFAQAYSKQAFALLDQTWISGLPRDPQIEKSKSLIDQAILLDPQSSEAFTALGYWYEWSGDVEKAYRAYEQAMALGPNNATVLARYGNMFVRSDPNKTIKLFSKAIELDPRNVFLKRQLALVMPFVDRAPEGIRMMEGIVAEHPDSAASYRDLAGLYSNQEFRHDKGIRALRRAYELDPNHPPNSITNAIMHWRLADYDNTALWNNNIARLIPDPEQARLYRGLAYIAQRDFESAREELALPAPGYNLYWMGIFYLGAIDVEEGRPEEAIERYKDFAAIFSGRKTNANFYYGIAAIKAYEALGDQKRAQALIDELLSILDANPSVTYHDSAIHEASIYALSGQVDKAIATLEEWVNRGGATSLLQQEIRHGLGVLADDPRYQSILHTVNNRLSEQKANLARWEASGEMPPMPREVTDPP
jgi:TolB-like protein/cytochrome c-type biogenesis protein CcmH/NrfG